MGVTRWLLKKVKGIDKERMNKTIDIIAKESGKSKLYIKFDIFINFLTRGCGYTDYFRGNYIALSGKEKDTFVTAKSFYKFLRYMNDKRYEVILHDKIVFNKFFKKYIKREWITLSSVEELAEFLKGKDVVFAKSPVGEGGHGVTKIITKDWDVEELYEELMSKNQVLIEEAVKQSAELNKINPSVVNSFRIVTIYKDGKVYIVGNALRVNKGTEDVIGCTDDIYFSLNEDGRVSGNAIDDYGTIYTKHPLTNRRFANVYIKDVKEAFNLVKKLHLEIKEMRYIGWDIAFTEDGPELMEGNEYPGYGILQFYKLHDGKRTGHKKEIADILNAEMQDIDM